MYHCQQTDKTIYCSHNTYVAALCIFVNGNRMLLFDGDIYANEDICLYIYLSIAKKEQHSWHLVSAFFFCILELQNIFLYIKRNKYVTIRKLNSISLFVY